MICQQMVYESPFDYMWMDVGAIESRRVTDPAQASNTQKGTQDILQVVEAIIPETYQILKQTAWNIATMA